MALTCHSEYFHRMNFGGFFFTYVGYTVVLNIAIYHRRATKEISFQRYIFCFTYKYVIALACATSYLFSSPLLCFSLVDMRVNLGAPFVLILSCLVSDRRELLLSERKLENLFYFTC